MFLAFREEVEEALASALSSLSLPTDDLGVEEPPEGVDAVLASSVAFRLAGEVGAPPPEVASDVADAIDAGAYEYVEAVAAQGPYVNFVPNDAYYADTLASAQDDGFGRLPDRETSVIVEHTS
ncbi:MAG TPA: arginine--tRNA ligase, partial [Halobacteriales archaeon]|nr:arginine--tRNA ligase [Halobacteriales archaeon]